VRVGLRAAGKTAEGPGMAPHVHHVSESMASAGRDQPARGGKWGGGGGTEPESEIPSKSLKRRVGERERDKA
jgi:hypothetical protein